MIKENTIGYVVHCPRCSSASLTFNDDVMGRFKINGSYTKDVYCVCKRCNTQFVILTPEERCN